MIMNYNAFLKHFLFIYLIFLHIIILNVFHHCISILLRAALQTVAELKHAKATVVIVWVSSFFYVFVKS